MKILVHFDFDTEQIGTMRRLVQEDGERELVHVTSEEEALSHAPETEAVLGHFTPALCAAAPGLRWIQSFSAGMNNFLFPEIVARDEVTVTNMAGIYAPQGGEHAWALLLALTRCLDEAVLRQQQRAWNTPRAPVEWKTPRPLVELAGSTLGLVGLGGFGMEMLRRAQGYDMRVLALDPVRGDQPAGVVELKPPGHENLHALLRRSDVVMIACPRTPETYRLIGREELSLMKKSAYLINVTRGGIIDEAALIEALREGSIAGAGLDVCEEEPLPAGHPLWEAPNLIITPHRAGASQHRPRKTFELFCRNLERYLKGEELLNLVDKKRGF